MKLRLSHIIFAAVAAVALMSACRHEEARIIPRSTMSKIYADMLMTDQWISANRGTNRQADTSLVYEPIFNEYGYTSDDFRASRAYYLKDAERYSRILKKTSEMLIKRQKELKAQKEILDAIRNREENMKAYIPEKIYSLSGMYDKETFVEADIKFYVDTTGSPWTFDPIKDIDTLYTGPMLVIPEPKVEGEEEEESEETEEETTETEEVAKDTVAVTPKVKEEVLAPEPEPEAEPKPTTVKEQFNRYRQRHSNPDSNQQVEHADVAI